MSSQMDAIGSRHMPHPARKVMLALGELHAKGVERLRLAPSMAPSGAHWRFQILPVDFITPGHGALATDEAMLVNDDYPRGSVGVEDDRLGFGDRADTTPLALADLSLEQFPRLTAGGSGSDEPYCRWYRDMLDLTEPDDLIYAFADYEVEPPRVLRRLPDLRDWSHEQPIQVFPRGPRACGSDGRRAPQGLSIAVGHH